MIKLRLILFILTGISVVTSCRMRTPTSESLSDPVAAEDSSQLGQWNMEKQRYIGPENPKSCLAVRGNGNYIFAHFYSIAKLIEEFGIFDGIAGGSSASITSFIYNAILSNPMVWNCDGKVCDRSVAEARIAFLFKALTAVPEVALEEFSALTSMSGNVGGDQMALVEDFLDRGYSAINDKAWAVAYEKVPALSRRGIIGRIARRIAARKIPEEIAKNVDPLIKSKANEALTSKWGKLINPWYTKHLAEYGTHANVRVLNSMKEAMHAYDFVANDSSVLVREGIMNLDEVLFKVYSLMRFYGGKLGSNTKLATKTQTLIEQCAETTSKKAWYVWKYDPKLKSCQDRWVAHLKEYAATAEPLKSPDLWSRPVGESILTLISASHISGKGAQSIQDAKDKYHAYMRGEIPSMYRPKSLPIDFDRDVNFGYWGPEYAMAKLERAAKEQQLLRSQGKGHDEKVAKFLGLGPARWYDALYRSAGEPGIVPASPIEDKDGNLEAYTAGGWVDLHPTKALKIAGCEEVLYLTREFPTDTVFGVGAAQVVGGANHYESLYGPKKGTAFDKALEAADAIYCTDWTKYLKFKEGTLEKGAEGIMNQFAWLEYDAYKKGEIYFGNKDSQYQETSLNIMSRARTGCQPF